MTFGSILTGYPCTAERAFTVIASHLQIGFVFTSVLEIVDFP